MVRSGLAAFAIIICGIYMQAYWVMRERYNEVPELKYRLGLAHEELAQQKLRLALQSEQLNSFRMDVAAVLPELRKENLNNAKDYSVRNLASVTRDGRAETVPEAVAGTMFSTAKMFFRDGKYDRANKLFRKLIDNYGYSPNVIEAHFLMAEGQYQLGDLEAATSTIKDMIELFPESELTGFAMIRLGQIFESRNRYEEAVQIYRTTLKAFPYRSVAMQAEQKLRSMEP